MRIRVVLAVAALAFVLAPAARAATLPDLPGMGPAQKAVGGGATTTSASTPTTRAKRMTPTTTSASTSEASTTADAAKTIRSLPGGAALPVIGKVQSGLASARGAIPGPDGLVVLAALGSFAALGSLYLLRRLNRI